MTKTLSIYFLAFAVLVAAVLFFIKPFDTAFGSGYLGFPVHLQTATTTTVGPDTTVTIFADAADCKNRVVTTVGTEIRLSFDDTTGFGSTTLASNVGHVQLSSTTVAYESGLYGCGRFTAWAPASTTITISSF